MRYRAHSEVMWKIMAERGESTRTLARKVGCSHVMIWALQSGRKTCSEGLADRISQALELSREVLFFTRSVK